MAPRGFWDVPNRVVRLFLQEAGHQYDENRDLPKFVFRRLPDEVLKAFGYKCAYCGGSAKTLVEEHVVPMNRKLLGLHAWGNIVPACKPCNDLKSPMDSKGITWQSHPKLDQERREHIEKFIKKYGYAPVTHGLEIVMEKLYSLTLEHAKSLVDFGVVAAQPFIAGLHQQVPIAEDVQESDPE